MRVSDALFGVLISFSTICWTSRGTQLYTLTDLGDLPGGLNQSTAMGINSIGEVTGYSAASGGDKAFIWTPISPNSATGSLTAIYSSFARAWGINDSGQISGYITNDSFLWTPSAPHGTTGSLQFLGGLAGYGLNNYGQVVGSDYITNLARNYAFIWTPDTPNGKTGSITDLGDLPGGANETYAYRINSAGQVVGKSGAATGNRAFLWSPDSANGKTGSMIDLGDLPGGGDASTAWGISGSGCVLGESGVDGGTHAFLWTPEQQNGHTGTMVDLGALQGGTTSRSYDMNLLGQIVGTSDGPRVASAVLWTSASEMIDLNAVLDTSGQGWTLWDAMGINDLGQIVGNGIYDPDGPVGADGVHHAFLLTPVPEASITTLSAFLTLACLMSRKLRFL